MSTAPAPITHESLEALSSGFNALAPRDWDDDARSVTTTISNVSVFPTWHAVQRQNERDVSVKEIQRAKASGLLSLSIQMLGMEDTESTILEIQDWGRKILAQFRDLGLEIGEPIVRGAGSRVEMQLLQSQRQGRTIKTFLRTEGYFSGERIRRLQFTDRRGEREVVVVEGAGRNTAVE
eukprot:1573834-Rhodomonas_salina.1